MIPIGFVIEADEIASVASLVMGGPDVGINGP